MDEGFIGKYKENIFHKQKCINDYQLAVSNLLLAIQKRGKLKNKSMQKLNETAESIMNTITDLDALQRRKINLKKTPRLVFKPSSEDHLHNKKPPENKLKNKKQYRWKNSAKK